MVFNSIEFIIFFLVVGIFYYALPKKYQNPVLIVANYMFYAFFAIKLIPYLVLTTVFTYFIGMKIGKAKDNSTAKKWLILGGGYRRSRIMYL